MLKTRTNDGGLGKKVDDMIQSSSPGGFPGPGFSLGSHDSSNLLPWHRYLLTLYEDAIVNECGWHTGLPCELTLLVNKGHILIQ
jgi:hypothetical protein